MKNLANKIAPLLMSLLFAQACGKDNGDDNDNNRTGAPSTGPAGEIADTSEAGFLAFMKAGSYREWSDKQPSPIDSVPAHSAKTQTFFNVTAATAATAGQNPLPKGSIVIKDIFESDGVTLKAQAAMAKIADGTGGDTWVWYEVFLPEYNNTFYGKGLSSCTGCHSSGSDFVRSSVP